MLSMIGVGFQLEVRAGNSIQIHVSDRNRIILSIAINPQWVTMVSANPPVREGSWSSGDEARNQTIRIATLNVYFSLPQVL